ncbi:hypothetical protein [Haloarchaeobius sp. DFWS5]|uniref:hypothetical protein n=1 Tax=Haloarchaeobius sp. DFWS5 TaxID=3446114 RepID=UPI003EBE628A
MDHTPPNPNERDGRLRTDGGEDEESGSFPMNRRELLLSGASYATIGIAGCDRHLVSLAQVRRAAEASTEAGTAAAVASRRTGNSVASTVADAATTAATLQDEDDEEAELAGDDDGEDGDVEGGTDAIEAGEDGATTADTTTDTTADVDAVPGEDDEPAAGTESRSSSVGE